MDISTYIIIVLVATIAITVKIAFGIGSSIVSMSLLSLVIDPKSAIVITAILDVVSNSGLMLSNFRKVKWKEVVKIIPGMILGTLIGVNFLSQMDTHLISYFLAGAIIFSVLRNGFVKKKLSQLYRLSLSKWLNPYKGSLSKDKSSLSKAVPTVFRTFQPTRFCNFFHSSFFNKIAAYGAGLCGGLTGGIINVNGPPVLMYLKKQPLHPEILKSTLIATLFIDALWRSVLMSQQNISMNGQALLYAGLILIGFVFAWPLGRLCSRKFNEAGFENFIDGMLLLYAARLLI